jgi:predicted ATP-dependent serine protease
VVEADSSQQCAIAGIAIGQHAVIHGQPGTGKSQTITNLIATLSVSS